MKFASLFMLSINHALVLFNESPKLAITMKKALILLSLICTTFSLKATIHTIQIWDGYFQFLPNTLSIQLGDTIQWLPLDPPSVTHTITSDSIPDGAEAFDQIWRLPADTFFQYIPQVIGLYKYVCTPHASMGMVGEFRVSDSPSAVNESKELRKPTIVYPNPATDMIRFKDLTEEVDYKLIDINGKLIGIGVTVQGEVNISSLSPGMYFVDIIGDNREIVRFIKQ